MQAINEIQPIFPEKKGCMGAGKTQAVIVDHKETYESCFQDAKLTRVSNHHQQYKSCLGFYFLILGLYCRKLLCCLKNEWHALTFISLINFSKRKERLAFKFYFLGWSGSTHLTRDPITVPGRSPGWILKLCLRALTRS